VSCVSGSFVSVRVVQLRFWWRRDEGEVNGAARWYQVTPTAKQARILEESSGGSGEALVCFKVVCPRSGVRRWMWRGPTRLSCLGDLGSGAVFRSFGV